MRAAELDAVTLDAHGTILRVVDPLPRLRELLPGHDAAAIADAFAAEAHYYRKHVGRGADAVTLHLLASHRGLVLTGSTPDADAATPEVRAA